MGSAWTKTPLDELFEHSIDIKVRISELQDDVARAEDEHAECRGRIIAEMRGAKNEQKLKYLALDATRMRNNVESLNETIQDMQTIDAWLLKTHRMGVQSESIEKVSRVISQMTQTKYDPRRTEQLSAEFFKQLESLKEHTKAGAMRVDAMRKETTDEIAAEEYLRELQDQLELEKVQTVPDISHMVYVQPEANALAPSHFDDELFARLQMLSAPPEVNNT